RDILPAGLALDLDDHECRDVQTDRFAIDTHAEALDHAVGDEALQPAGDGTARDVHAFGQGSNGQARIRAELRDDRAVDLVHVHRFGMVTERSAQYRRRRLSAPGP